MLSLIVFVMGGTCVGKSTLIHSLQDYHPSFGSVEVGKKLREKYPPEHFKGLNNPAHTADEAWNLCESLVQSHIDQQTRIILVDGQPRTKDQVDKVISAWGDTRRLFLMIDAPMDVRERRARDSRVGNDLETLALPRLRNDLISYYDVLVRLAEYDICPHVIRTSNDDDPYMFASNVGGWLLAHQNNTFGERYEQRSICGSWQDRAIRLQPVSRSDTGKAGTDTGTIRQD